jgi:hypothetical protein
VLAEIDALDLDLLEARPLKPASGSIETAEAIVGNHRNPVASAYLPGSEAGA